MNSSRTSVESRRAEESSSTMLRGRPLTVARTLWILVAALALATFAASVSPHFAVLRSVCSGGPGCALGQLTVAAAARLGELGVTPDGYAAFELALGVTAAVWLAAGALVFWRRSDDWMALLVALQLVTQGATSFTDVLESARTAWQVPASLLDFVNSSLLFLVFSLFPSGRFVPRWTRWLAVGWIIHHAINLFVNSLPPSPWLVVLFFLAFLGFLVSFIFAQVYRYRRVSNPVQRRQTKWVVFGVAAALAGMVSFLLPFSFTQSPDKTTISMLGLIQTAGGDTFMLLIPLSIGVAVLRSQLFDIDRIINRTLVYGTLTASLALVYIGSVVVLQQVFRLLTGGESQLAVVASTLAIAALFGPLHRHIQTLIDRRFYRRKYDAAKILETFSTRLQAETDLKSLNAELLSVVRETLQPEHVSLWLREPEESGTKDGTRG